MSIQCDFSELQKLVDKIEKSVNQKNQPNAIYNTDKIIKGGMKVVMESVLRNTPIGENGSNWWDHKTNSYYPLGAGKHREGTLRRGWVMDTTVRGATEYGGDATSQQMAERVERTTVNHKGNESSMKITNNTPYAGDVEWGHNVVIGGRVCGYVDGGNYARDGIGNSKKNMRRTMKQELTKQLEEVVKI